MPDFNIDQIIAGGAGASTRADFSKLGDIPDAYRKGADFAYQQKLRNVFSDENGGLPRDQKSGAIDWGQAYERLVQQGGAPAIDAAGSLATSGLTQDRMRYAPTVSGLMEQPGPGAQPGAPISPPSVSRGIPRPDSLAGKQGGDSPGSLVSFVSAAGIPDEDAGSHINVLGGQLSAALGRRIDPNAPLDMQDPKVRQVLAGYRRGGIQAPDQPPQQAAPAQMAGPPSANRSAPAVVAPQLNRGGITAPQATVQAPPQSDPTLGGLIPPGYPDPGSYLSRLQAVAASGRVLPDQLKTLEQKIGAIQTALQPTQDQKNARAAGVSLTDYQNRSDDNMAQRDILTKSILPKLDSSQEKAIAARDDIDAIHRARGELDQKGGVFSGAFADKKLYLAKAAELLGVPNADKIQNTESYGAAIGQRVAVMVKAFGSGTAISDGDRRFAAAMAGGQVTLDEKSMRRILDIGEKAARGKIELHNGLADRTLKSTEALKGYSDVYRVQQPGQYQHLGASPPPKTGDVVDGHQFLGGNPKDPRAWKSL